jgi:hypothetical protein
MYMAPEQAQGQTLDQRADLFSLGSVLYQMVTGRPPFRANTTVAVLKRVAEDQPRAIREIIPETPQWLCDIIAKLHAKNPADRYQSAREVADVLADCEAQLKANARLKDFSRIPRGKSPRSGRWKWVAAAVLLLPVIALAVTEFAGVTHLFRGQEATNDQSEGWVQLFNGKDLTGWKPNPNWTARDGVLESRGGGALDLVSERNDYANFRLRVEARINDGGNSGIFIRRPAGAWSRELYEVQINADGDPIKTGSLWNLGPEKAVKENPIKPDEWFALEVTAIDNEITVTVNGKVTAHWTDPDRRYVKGALHLQQYTAGTLVQFRKIEIKELPATSPEVPRTAADVLPFLAGSWKVDREDLGPNLPQDKIRSAGYLTYDYVASGKLLRARGNIEYGNAHSFLLHAYDPGQQRLRLWHATSTGHTDGPATGVFNSDSRTLTWTSIDEAGAAYNHQFTFAGPDKITTQLYRLDKKNNIVRILNQTLTRVKEPVAIPGLPTDPNRPDEMKVLDRLVGEWRNEITVTDIAAPDKPKTEMARVKAELVLGGRFVEMIDTNEATGGSDYTLHWYDPTAMQYREWFFNGRGYVLEFTGTWDEATKTLTWNSADRRLEGHWVFKGDDLREFRHLTKAADGKVVNEAAGVSRRTASPAVAPFTDADVRRIAALPAAEQVEQVRKELMRRNPGFDGKVEHKIEDGVVTELRIVTDQVTDIAPIRVFNALRVLDCSGTFYNRPNGLLADLRPLKGMNLAGLTHLNLSHTKVSDAGMVYFKDCKNLTFLDLWETKVTDEGLANFQGCKNLSLLNLGTTRASDAGLVHFKNCKNLTALYLFWTNVSDAGLVHFQDCKDLSKLNLAGTRVSDVGVAHFKNCKNLTHLHLDHTQVGDAGLAQFKGMPLTVLWIDKTGITDLTPLQGMPLEDIRLTPKNISRGLNILRDMKSLKTIGVGWDRSWPAAEFWERYDKGEFKW